MGKSTHTHTQYKFSNISYISEHPLCMKFNYNNDYCESFIKSNRTSLYFRKNKTPICLLPKLQLDFYMLICLRTHSECHILIYRNPKFTKQWIQL